MCPCCYLKLRQKSLNSFFLYMKSFWEKKILRNAGMFCFDIFSENKMLPDSQIKIFNFDVLN